LLESRLKILAQNLYLLRDVVEFTEVHDKGGYSFNDEGSHVSIQIAIEIVAIEVAKTDA